MDLLETVKAKLLPSDEFRGKKALFASFDRQLLDLTVSRLLQLQDFCSGDLSKPKTVPSYPKPLFPTVNDPSSFINATVSLALFQATRRVLLSAQSIEEELPYFKSSVPASLVQLLEGSNRLGALLHDVTRCSMTDRRGARKHLESARKQANGNAVLYHEALQGLMESPNSVHAIKLREIYRHVKRMEIGLTRCLRPIEEKLLDQ